MKLFASSVVFLAILSLIAVAHLERQKIYLLEWKYRYQLQVYKTANSDLPPAKNRIVFYGDSITYKWAKSTPFFAEKQFIDRGLPGQTTEELRIRSKQDVIDLHPAVVVILAGANDIGGTEGYVPLETTEANLKKMAESASNHGIRVILCSVLPAAHYSATPNTNSVPKIILLNEWIKQYASNHGLMYVDYWSAMTDQNGGMKQNLSADGVHPNAAGFAVMESIIERPLGMR